MNDTELKLLNDYKEYDYLNTNRQTPLIKILVSYIKPSFLFKSDILTPIHLGRAVETEISKDGKISDKDLEWLHQNCLSDDNFNNSLSEYNRRIGFFTGTWWAYNNYEKLGNPDYFGSFGYRKLLPAESLSQLKEYELIVPLIRENYLASNQETFINFHGKLLFNKMKAVFIEQYPQHHDFFEEYAVSKYGYYHELYIMKKYIFFNFCQWLFPLVAELIKTNPQDFALPSQEKLTQQDLLLFNNDSRDIAYALEYLTGFYCFLQIKKGVKHLESNWCFIDGEEAEMQRAKQTLNFLRRRLKNTESK